MNADMILTIVFTSTITSSVNTITTMLLYKTLFKRLGITKKEVV